MRKLHIEMQHVPPRSPDLNPVEKFWGWLRKALRRRDLKDLKEGKPVLSKAAHRVRIRDICRTRRAQRVAQGYWKGFRSACKRVIKNGGAAA